MRLYKEFQANNDPKWRKVAQEVGITENYEHPPVTEVEVSHEAADELIGASIQQPDRGPTPPTPSPEAPTPAAQTPLFARFDGYDTPRTPQKSAPSAVAAQDETMDTEVLMDGEPPYDLEMPGLMDDDDDDNMVATLIIAGANADQARTYAAAVKGRTDNPTFMEFFGRGSIIKEANRARRCLDIRGLHA